MISHARTAASAPRATRAWTRRRGEIVAYIDDDALPGPGLAHLPRGGVRDDRPRRGRRAEPPAARRRRRSRPLRRATPRAGRSHVLLSDTRGRAHPRLQHGVPPRRAAGDRRLRPAVPRRRRRRRRLLAPAGARARRSGSTRPRSSGTAGARPCARFWRQQRGYGRAEALLERKWPEKYNRRGHAHLGRAALRPRRARACSAGRASTTASGAPAPSSPS